MEIGARYSAPSLNMCAEMTASPPTTLSSPMLMRYGSKIVEAMSQTFLPSRQPARRKYIVVK